MIKYNIKLSNLIVYFYYKYIIINVNSNIPVDTIINFIIIIFIITVYNFYILL